MRIPCPFCGLREASEFVYRGDATVARPHGEAADDASMAAYVYLRDNPSGPHEEHWHHALGCRTWLIVRRDTRTHAILEAKPAGASQ